MTVGVKFRKAWRACIGALAALLLVSAGGAAHAAFIRDLVSVQGVRSNPLVGYGIVAGLDGTGDQVRQVPFAQQSVQNMLAQLGITVTGRTNMQLRDMASVMVTASLPPFAQPGQTIDVVVSSIGNARSLRGGTLLMTPLKGVDGQVYALAQGNVLIGGASAGAGRNRIQVNQLNGGRISGGAVVERSVPAAIVRNGIMRLELKEGDYETAENVANAVNLAYGNTTASVANGRVIEVHVPPGDDANQFLARVQALRVERAPDVARVIINARTGSVVMNREVTLDESAVSHGNLTVLVHHDEQVNQPNTPFAGGRTVVTPTNNVTLVQDAGGVKRLPGGANLRDVVSALNALGATPQELLAILQAMQAAGVLHAELEII